MPEWKLTVKHSKMSKLAFSVPFSIISNKPTTTKEFDAFHSFMLIKIQNKLTKAVCTLQWSVVRINKHYIPEHQNKLNIHDLQNYEFLPKFFQPKKVGKIC